MSIINQSIGIIGLGYVGLPLAVAFSEKHNVVGIDISQQRIDELKNGDDQTNEIQTSNLLEAINNGFSLTSNIEEAKDCKIFIVTVPTPVNSSKQPDLNPVISATKHQTSSFWSLWSVESLPLFSQRNSN